MRLEQWQFWDAVDKLRNEIVVCWELFVVSWECIAAIWELPRWRFDKLQVRRFPWQATFFSGVRQGATRCVRATLFMSSRCGNPGATSPAFRKEIGRHPAPKIRKLTCRPGLFRANDPCRERHAGFPGNQVRGPVAQWMTTTEIRVP